MYPNSNVWLRKTIFGRQFGIICQTYHKLLFDEGRSAEYQRCGDAAGENRAIGGPQESGQYQA